MRQLATIQEIASITPIEGADAIELAKFKGLFPLSQGVGRVRVEKI